VTVSVYVGSVPPPPHVPPQMPIISRGLPSTSTSLNDSAYETNASGSENAININSVSSAAKSAVVVYMMHNATRPAVVGTGPGYFGVPQNYTIDIHTSTSGTKPTSGWTTLDTITNAVEAQRTFPASGTYDMSSAGWFRINVTTARGGTASMEIDLHDCRNGRNDSILFVGDSNCMQCFNQNGLDGSGVAWQDGPLETQLEASTGRSAPIIVNAGIGGETAQSWAQSGGWAEQLADYPCHYVHIGMLGTNDINRSVMSGALIDGVVANFKTMTDLWIAHGKVVLIGTCPWGNANAGQPTNAANLNAGLATLIASYGGAVKDGCDAYGVSNGQHSLINADGLHFSWLASQSATSSHPMGIPDGLAGYEACLWDTERKLRAAIYTP